MYPSILCLTGGVRPIIRLHHGLVIILIVRMPCKWNLACLLSSGRRKLVYNPLAQAILVILFLLFVVSLLKMDLFYAIPSIVGGLIEGIGISNMWVLTSQNPKSKCWLIIATRLFGVAAAQFYMYMQDWEHDAKWIRAVASIVMYVINVCSSPRLRNLNERFPGCLRPSTQSLHSAGSTTIRCSPSRTHSR